jgi:hypothetical protein
MKKVLVVLIALFCLVGMTNAQSKFGASVQGAVGLPMGDFGDLCKTGFGALGTGTYTINPNLDIIATVGYMTFSFKNVDDASFSVIPILGGVRYYFGKDKFRPYVTGMAGIFSGKTKIKIFGFDVETTSSDFGFSAGGGFMYELGKKMDLDVTAAYSSVSSGGATTNWLTVGAGLHFAF